MQILGPTPSQIYWSESPGWGPGDSHEPLRTAGGNAQVLLAVQSNSSSPLWPRFLPGCYHPSPWLWTWSVYWKRLEAHLQHQPSQAPESPGLPSGGHKGISNSTRPNWKELLRNLLPLKLGLPLFRSHFRQQYLLCSHTRLSTIFSLQDHCKSHLPGPVSTSAPWGPTQQPEWSFQNVHQVMSFPCSISKGFHHIWLKSKHLVVGSLALHDLITFYVASGIPFGVWGQRL